MFLQRAPFFVVLEHWVELLFFLVSVVAGGVILDSGDVATFPSCKWQ